VTREREATRDTGAATVATRLQLYAALPTSGAADVPVSGAGQAPTEAEDLLERATTLLAIMPPRPRRATIEELVCPNDPDRGRRAVEALIERSLAAEDERGCLRLLG